jgi:hypothetical protein
MVTQSVDSPVMGRVGLEIEDEAVIDAGTLRSGEDKLLWDNY